MADDNDGLTSLLGSPDIIEPIPLTQQEAADEIFASQNIFGMLGIYDANFNGVEIDDSININSIHQHMRNSFMDEVDYSMLTGKVIAERAIKRDIGEEVIPVQYALDRFGTSEHFESAVELIKENSMPYSSRAFPNFEAQLKNEYPRVQEANDHARSRAFNDYIEHFAAEDNHDRQYAREGLDLILDNIDANPEEMERFTNEIVNNKTDFMTLYNKYDFVKDAIDARPELIAELADRGFQFDGDEISFNSEVDKPIIGLGIGYEDKTEQTKQEQTYAPQKVTSYHDEAGNSFDQSTNNLSCKGHADTKIDELPYDVRQQVEGVKASNSETNLELKNDALSEICKSQHTPKSAEKISMARD